MDVLNSGHLAGVGAGSNGDEDDNRRAMEKLKNRCEGDPPLNSGLAKVQHCRKRSRDGGEVIPACTECGKKFGSPKALYGHMRLHPERAWRGINRPEDGHGGHVGKKEKDVAASLVRLLSGDDQVDGSSSYRCSTCKRVFGSRQALGGHRASHRNVKGCYALERDGDGGGGESERVEVEEQEKKPVLDLDLNFPAPEEDDG